MESRKVTRVSPIYHSAVLRASFVVSVCFVSSQWSRFLLRKKCGCADICFEQTKHSSCLLKLKLIIHECFSRPSLCVLAYKFLELMVNQMVQRLLDPPRPNPSSVFRWVAGLSKGMQGINVSTSESVFVQVYFFY